MDNIPLIIILVIVFMFIQKCSSGSSISGFKKVKSHKKAKSRFTLPHDTGAPFEPDGYVNNGVHTPNALIPRADQNVNLDYLKLESTQPLAMTEEESQLLNGDISNKDITQINQDDNADLTDSKETFNTIRNPSLFYNADTIKSQNSTIVKFM